MSAAYVLDAIRTPFGRDDGGLSTLRPDDLAAHVVRTLLDRNPALEGAAIDEILFGSANQAGLHDGIDGGYQIDIHLQGESETVFFAV